MESYKAAVVARLEKPLKRSKRDITKLNEVLDENELGINLNAESIKEQVEKEYENTFEVYKYILKRLKKFEKKFL